MNLSDRLFFSCDPSYPFVRCHRRNFNNVDRPTFFYFLQRLLGSGARTADASKADYFFIPVSVWIVAV